MKQFQENKVVRTVFVALSVVALIFVIISQIYNRIPVTVGISYAFDVSEPKEVVKNVDHIYIGEVVNQVKPKYRGDAIPYTHYVVRVVDVIKGTSSNQTQVLVMGGKNDQGKEFIVEGQTLLEKGKRYLFATTDDKEFGKGQNWELYTQVVGYNLDTPENKNVADRYRDAVATMQR